MALSQSQKYPSFSLVHKSTLSAMETIKQHLIDSRSVIRLKVDRDRQIYELNEGGTQTGHALNIPYPRESITDATMERVENYGKAISMWRNLSFDVKWNDSSAIISFSAPPLVDEPETRPSNWQLFRKFVKDCRKSRTEKATENICKFLSESGFRVREPFSARLVMLDHEYSGSATVVRYPLDKSKDKIGILSVYDRLLPMLADAIGREKGLSSEVQKTDEAIAVYFTKNRKYKGSLYGASADLRLVAARPRAHESSYWQLIPGASHRACRRLYAQYRKDFLTTKRPIPALGKHGHTLILHYRKGARGSVVDNSYVYTVGKMVEKLKHHYGLNATMHNNEDARVILVTFYTTIDSKSKS